MIKVIASDMDGTLLNDAHRFTDRTLTTIEKACRKGIRFIIVTGRSYPMTIAELEKKAFPCDYILASGAEVRDRQGKIILQHLLKEDVCRELCVILGKYPVVPVFLSNTKCYQVGAREQIESNVLKQMRSFHVDRLLTDEEIRRMPRYRQLLSMTEAIPDKDGFGKVADPLYKMMVYSGDTKLLERIKKELNDFPPVASASSFLTNIEVTDVKAQKGPILKDYIQSLGYTMDEVMVMGDSMNDYSMLSMDFGVTVAMGNSIPEILQAAKYITGSNEEDGAACAIERFCDL